jgi:hypothetical protein
MDEQEWLRRIDEHLETSKHYMREGNELMARLDETMARTEKAMERNTEAFLDLRGFLQQVTTVLGALVTEIRDGRREQSESWQEWRRESRAWRTETREWHRALSEQVDRLNPEPPPSAA